MTPSIHYAVTHTVPYGSAMCRGGAQYTGAQIRFPCITPGSVHVWLLLEHFLVKL